MGSLKQWQFSLVGLRQVTYNASPNADSQAPPRNSDSVYLEWAQDSAYETSLPSCSAAGGAQTILQKRSSGGRLPRWC